MTHERYVALPRTVIEISGGAQTIQPNRYHRDIHSHWVATSSDWKSETIVQVVGTEFPVTLDFVGRDGGATSGPPEGRFARRESPPKMFNGAAVICVVP